MRSLRSLETRWLLKVGDSCSTFCCGLIGLLRSRVMWGAVVVVAIVISDASKRELSIFPEGWKVFQYPQFGYMLALPPGYRVYSEQIPIGEDRVIQTLSLSGSDSGAGDDSYVVHVESVGATGTSSDPVEERVMALVGYGVRLKSRESRRINEILWSVISFGVGDQSATELQYLTVWRGRMYSVTGRNRELLEKILQTVKFG